MDEDIATGKRIARQCKQMSIAAFASALGHGWKIEQQKETGES